MLNQLLRDFWAEDAPTHEGGRSTADRLVVAVLVVVGVVDGLVSSDVAWPAVTIPIMATVPLVLWHRRSRPLPVAAIVSLCFVALHGAMLIAGVSSTMVNVGVICVTVYSLTRWASGREAVIGLGLSSLATIVGGSTGLMRTVEGAIALPVFVSLFGLIGLSVRLWSSRSSALVSEAKTLERTRIARELHDSVAHHVSAIAVQAQGAQEILASDPAAAAGALAVIEQQASKTLVEMRLILGVLRDRDGTERSPQPGLTDIERLAEPAGSGPAIAVMMSGELEHVENAVTAGLYRLAQEAITNARRHARGASQVLVRVEGFEDHVRLTVADDGQTAPPAAPGYGLVGMQERASLLGGECTAGPAADGGWLVEARLPSNGLASNGLAR